MELEFKKHRQGYEVNVFESKRKNRESCYRNIIDKDPNKLAQILIDLYMYGFPIEKAIHIYFEKVRKKDWLGL
jgi:hypothetical protein